MSIYTNWLTIMGPRSVLRRLNRTIHYEMAIAKAQYQVPFNFDEVKYPRDFTQHLDSPSVKKYKFYTGFMPITCVKRLSKRFPSVVFNLTFDICRDIWDKGYEAEGFAQTGNFNVFGGKTACGCYTLNKARWYPARDAESDEMNSGAYPD